MDPYDVVTWLNAGAALVSNVLAIASQALNLALFFL